MVLFAAVFAAVLFPVLFALGGWLALARPQRIHQRRGGDGHEKKEKAQQDSLGLE